MSNPKEKEEVSNNDVLGSFEGDPHCGVVGALVRDAVNDQEESELFVLDPKWVFLSRCLLICSALEACPQQHSYHLSCLRYFTSNVHISRQKRSIDATKTLHKKLEGFLALLEFYLSLHPTK